MSNTITPLVSIVIPVYNGSNYLAQAIDSALAQTYPNFEVLVINDGSNDEGKTRDIALSYGNRIRYYEKKNGGVATALNLGIEKMHGEYFSWLSHDDLYLPHKVQSQIDLLKNHPSKTAIIYSGYELIDEHSNVFAQIPIGNLHSAEKLAVPLYPVLHGLVHGCTLLIHKSHFDRVGGFDPKLPTTQDYDLWFRMFQHAEILFQNDMVVQGRQHAEQGHKHLGHASECDRLWISMVDNVSVDEMRQMEGSVFRFYKKTAALLKTTPYEEAYRHVVDLMRNINERVSVIIPFHNRISLLLEAVRSVLGQTYPHYELILIDDGSTEDLTSLHRLIANRSHISYIRQEHRGVSSARNLGVRKATGDYIAFLDSDDRFLPKKLEVQVAFMQENDYCFSHTSSERIDMDGNAIDTVDSGSFSGNVYPEIISNCRIQTPTVMATRDLLLKHSFQEDIDLGEDVCLWIDIAYQHPIGGIPECLTQVRIGESTAANNRDKQIVGIYNIIGHLVENPRYSVPDYHVFCLIKAYSKLFLPEGKEEISSLVDHSPASSWLQRLHLGTRIRQHLKKSRVLSYAYFRVFKPYIRPKLGILKRTIYRTIRIGKSACKTNACHP